MASGQAIDTSSRHSLPMCMCGCYENVWRTGLCDPFSILKYAYTAVFPCFVLQDIMRSVMDDDVPDTCMDSITRCLCCMTCTMFATEALAKPEYREVSCVVYALMWLCTIPMSCMLRKVVSERYNIHECCCVSLLLSVMWWPCMLTQTENEMKL